MYFSKNSLMDIYRIRVKKVTRPNFNMILVWMEDVADNRQDCSSCKDQQLTLTWISFNEGMQRKLGISGDDTKKTIRGMINNFRDDYSDTINNLTQIATLEQVQYMTGLVESFIATCVEQVMAKRLDRLAN